ncbi:MAG: hypothetical protein NW226_02945 [Microscillaceae bacterium]|nr:hypothetical protein [Microscillaceae bacterium]
MKLLTRAFFILIWVLTLSPLSVSADEIDDRGILEDSSFYRANFLLNHTPLKTLKENKGWVSNKGTGFFKIGQNVIRADRFFNPDGTTIDITTTSLYISSLYAEYGLTDRLTAVVYAPLFFRLTLNRVVFEPSNETIEGDEFNSVGDIDLGFKFGLIRNKPFVLSVGLLFGIPTGNNAGGNTQLLQSGDGEFNQLLSLNAGYGASKSFFGVTVGFNHRTEGFSEEIRFGAEAGYNFSKNITGILKFDGVESFKNGNVEGTSNGIFSNNAEYLVITPEINYTFKDTYGVSANASIPLRGENTVNALSYSFGVFYKLKKKS